MKIDVDYRISDGVLEIRYDQNRNDHEARRKAVLDFLRKDADFFRRIFLIPSGLWRYPRKRGKHIR